jgi:hypothetical protein
MPRDGHSGFYFNMLRGVPQCATEVRALKRNASRGFRFKLRFARVQSGRKCLTQALMTPNYPTSITVKREEATLNRRGRARGVWTGGKLQAGA